MPTFTRDILVSQACLDWGDSLSLLDDGGGEYIFYGLFREFNFWRYMTILWSLRRTSAFMITFLLLIGVCVSLAPPWGLFMVTGVMVGSIWAPVWFIIFFFILVLPCFIPWLLVGFRTRTRIRARARARNRSLVSFSLFHSTTLVGWRLWRLWIAGGRAWRRTWSIRFISSLSIRRWSSFGRSFVWSIRSFWFIITFTRFLGMLNLNFWWTRHQSFPFDCWLPGRLWRIK